MSSKFLNLDTNSNLGENDNKAPSQKAVKTYVDNHHDNTKQDTLTAGNNITINNDTISATDTTYTAGSGIDITSNVISSTITVPTKISDLTDDTATNPVDKADTLTNLTASITELNYTDGVTSNIQTQLNNKQATISDLSDIRSGATLGSTSLQPNDNISELNNDSDYITSSYHDNTKQNTLVSGTNIKTINSTSILGSGDISIPTITVDSLPNPYSTNPLQNKAVLDYIVSRDENLISNGFATLGNNYNFSTFTFDGTDSYGSGGCFKKAGANSYPKTDEYMPIDITKRYKFSAYVKRNVAQAAPDLYYLDMYDIDRYSITDICVNSFANTTTTLAQDLKNGDTVVYLTDLSGWATSTSTNPHAHCMQIFNYQNSFGYTYPDYTRNVVGGSVPYSPYQGKYFNASDIDKTNNTVTLSLKAWDGTTIPAGTKVAQARGGGYYYFLQQTATTVNTWEKITGTTATANYRPGTAFARIGGIVNRSVSATYKITAVSFTAHPSYEDIPTVNNGLLSIKKNGITVQTFNANQSANVTADIIVPTKTSELNNDSGYITSSYHDNTKQDTLVSGINIKTINNTSVLGSGDIDTDNIFWCTYDVTTYDAITAALNAGKIPACYRSNYYYIILAKSSSSSSYIFICANGSNSRKLTCATDSTWSSSVTSLESTSNKKITISSSSTDTEYPSAKCVYDNLQTKQDTLTAGNNITISGDTISATDTTYTAGTNIGITNNQISFTGTIPTKTSDLTNDSGYVTSSYHDSTKYDASNPSGYITSADISSKQEVLTQTHQITTANISLVNTCNIYTITPSGATTFTFNGAVAGLTYTFELKITMNTIYSLTFPSSVKWLDDVAPDLSSTGIYYLVFRTDDGGTTWLGNSQGKWSL